jgi:hypothetical protein
VLFWFCLDPIFGEYGKIRVDTVAMANRSNRSVVVMINETFCDFEDDESWCLSIKVKDKLMNCCCFCDE